MNKDLKDRVFDLPQNILDKINHTINGLNGQHFHGVKRAEKLLNDKGNKEQELFIIRATSINQMWNSELDHLLEQYLEYKDSRQRLMDGEDSKTTKKKVVTKGAVIKKATKKIMVE